MIFEMADVDLRDWSDNGRETVRLVHRPTGLPVQDSAYPRISPRRLERLYMRLQFMIEAVP